MKTTKIIRPPVNLEVSVVSLIAAEIGAGAYLALLAPHYLSTRLTLATLILVFGSVIMIYRVKVRGQIRLALTILLIATLLLMVAHGDQFGAKATGETVVTALAQEHPDPIPVNAAPSAGARINIEGEGGRELALDHPIGDRSAEDITIDAQMANWQNDHESRSLVWSISRRNRTTRCGAITVSGKDGQESRRQVAQTFEAAVEQSTKSAKPSCY